MITQDELKKLFNYNHSTGIFTRLIATSRSSKVGEIAGALMCDGYITISIYYKRYPAHRLAWLYMTGSMPKFLIDHINGIKNDNRIDNLREATPSQNGQNKRKATSGNIASGLLGVSWDKSRNKWVARIKLNYKLKHIGFFNDKYEAHAAYLKEKRVLHEFCEI